MQLKSGIESEIVAFSDDILSDFINQKMKRHPLWFAADLNREAVLHSLEKQLIRSHTIEEFKTYLRQYRNFTMTGLIHKEYQNDTEEVMCGCSELADHCIQYACDWAHHFLKKSLGTPTDITGHEQQLLVVAMGKLGGRELNLSSDIDLIFLYTKDGFTINGRKQWSNVEYFTKLTQLVIKLLADITADGFVFRVDTRLRPYGDSGAVVISVDTLEQYYLEQGRGWERFAMIKARLITGSNQEQIAFQKVINPFVYRRYIDFSLLEVPRKLKRKIEAELRRRNLQDNIKLGKGGIREIEFIIQSIQLIHGGKQRALQTASTRLALEQIHQLALLSTDECIILEKGYLQLRHIEHCIQSFADEQTQLLPSNDLDKERLVYLCGYDKWSSFKQNLEQVRSSIHHIFKEQFQAAEKSTDGKKNSHLLQLKDIFLLPDQNIKNIEFIKSLGYSEPEQIIELINQFRKRMSGIIQLAGTTGDNLINELIPYLMLLCGHYQNSAQTFKLMVVLIEAIATRTAYLQLFNENIKTLEIVTDLFSKSVWIAAHATRYPLVIDDLLNPDWLKMSKSINHDEQLKQKLLRISEEDEELILSILREYKQSQFFQLASSFVSGYMDGQRLAGALSEVAEAILWQCYKLARIKVEQKYGQLSDKEGKDVEFAIIAMGKLGGKELGFSSDLDLVFIYDSCSKKSNGNKVNGYRATENRAIAASEFFMKIAQRLIHYLNTRMPNGVLYEIDTRLRPSGRSGLLVTDVGEFENYQLNEAWTWEHQSLVRARCLFGHSGLFKKFQAIKTAALSRAGQKETLLDEIKTMRLKMKRYEDAKMSIKQQIKQRDGGIIDLEFLVQYLVLKNTQQYTRLSELSGLIDQLKVMQQKQIMHYDNAELIRNSYLNQIDKLNSLTHQNQNMNAGQTITDDLKPNLKLLIQYGLYPWESVNKI